jgi:sporulation integral membrane protein YlbJ
MIQSKRQSRFFDLLICLGLAGAVLLLAIHPTEATTAATDALTLCYNVLIPSLFPYFVLTGMLTRSKLPQVLGRLAQPVMSPLFGVGGAGATALVLGLIGGYPVGARTVMELYDNGAITKREAEKLLSFCNNSGPAFIFGVAGAAVLGSGRLAFILYLSHIAGAVCTGLLLRGPRQNRLASASCQKTICPSGNLASCFVTSVTSSFTAVLNVCGFVLFFAVVVGMVTAFIPSTGAASAWALRFFTGALELSSGIWSLKDAGVHPALLTAAAAWMLGWGGLSVHCQTLSLTAGRGLRMGSYFGGKCLHGLLAALFAGAITFLCTSSVPVINSPSSLPVWASQTQMLVPLLPTFSAVFLYCAAQITLHCKKGVEKQR